MQRQVLWLLMVLVGLMAVGREVRAEVPLLELDTEFADFALNPESGDVAAVDAAAATVKLFAAKDLTGTAIKAQHSATVGSTPVSIAFKRFGEKSYFIVVCTEDATVYVLDGADLSRVAKITTGRLGSSSSFASTNPADPFVYFAYGSGHGSSCDAIDLRSMTHAGLVTGSMMDGAISASGDLMYRRGPWSPSGFDSLRRSNALTDKKPEFAPLHHEHTSAGPYVPDAFDEYTATLNSLHSADLTRKVATFKMSIVGFSAKQPVIFGTELQGNSNIPSRAGNSAGPITLRAASFNSLQVVGEPVNLSPKFGTTQGKPLPRGVGAQSDFKVVAARLRFLIDDRRERIVCGHLKQLAIVPFADFKLSPEPFLHVSLKSPPTVFVGKPTDLQFELLDPKVNISFSDLPEGASIEGTSLRWTPMMNQVGEHTITAQMKVGDLEKTRKFALLVINESSPLPFVPTGLVVSATGKTALCWSINHQGGAAETRLATVDLVKNQVLAQKPEGIRFQTPLIDDKHIYLFEPNGSFIQVHDVATLARVKTLYTDEAIQRLAIHRGETLLATGQSRSSAFQLADFSRRKLPSEGAVSLMGIGPIWNQSVLNDQYSGPRLLLALPNVATLGSSGEARNSPLFVLGEPRQATNGAFPGRLDQPANANAAPFRVQIENPGLNATARGPIARLSVIVQDWVHGSVVQRLTATQRIKVQNGPERTGAFVAATRSKVVLVWNDQLYQFELPQPLPPEFKTGITLTPQHSHIALNEAKNDELSLPHTASGGTGQKTFSLAFSTDGMSIDEKIGSVTVKPKELTARLLDTLMQIVPVYANDEPFTGLEQYEQLANETLQRVLGRAAKGVPVVIPIQVRAQDEDGQVSELRYVLLAELPRETVQERVKKAHAAMLVQVEKNKAMQAARVPGSDLPAKAVDGKALNPQTEEIRRLREKVESLESRIDLMTRQLNELIKKLDEPKK